jgi:hypothetical protein
VLLNNALIWNYSDVPMLIVCYTNHALDQFLEGLVKVTNRIVRVGGQSRSELLESLNLKEKRKLHWGKRNLFDLASDVHDRMSYLMSEIKGIQGSLEMITNHGGIVSLSALRKAGIIRVQHWRYFASQNYRVTEQLFIKWLEHGMYDCVPPNEVEENERQNVVQNIDGSDSELEDFHDVIDDKQPHMLEDMVDSELEFAISNYSLPFALDLKTIGREIKWRDVKIQYLRAQIKKDSSLVNAWHVQKGINADLNLRLNYIRRQLAQEGGVDWRTVERLLQQGNLWHLQAEERWILYRYWVDRLRNILLEKLRRKEACYRLEAGRYEEARLMIDRDILRDSLIVGMTTTGAAKFQSLLQALKAKIGK